MDYNTPQDPQPLSTCDQILKSLPKGSQITMPGAATCDKIRSGCLVEFCCEVRT